MRFQAFSRWLLLILLAWLLPGPNGQCRAAEYERKLLYVAEPGIRNYLEYGGHGAVGYDIADGHKLIRRIKASGLDEKGEPLNIKSIFASAGTQRPYVSTPPTLTCFDLVPEKNL